MISTRSSRASRNPSFSRPCARRNGVQSKAAKLLGINERSLWHRVKKLGIAITKRASGGEPAE